MPLKAGRGRGKKMAIRKRKRTVDTEEKGKESRKKISPSPNKNVEQSPRGSMSPEQLRGSPQRSEGSLQHSPTPSHLRSRQPESSDDEASSALHVGKSNPEVGKGKGDKGKSKVQNENPTPCAPYSFTEAQEEEIAGWIKSKKLLYDMKDKQYKDKALRRHLWEGKAAEYDVNYDSIQKWYHTQRTRFPKLREGQPQKNSQKSSGGGLSSGEEEDPILAEEASENDSDRDKFIRRVFWFLKPHTRRLKKDTPASFKDKLALAATGELAGSDDSTITGSLVDEPREPTKKYTGYPTPRPTSKTRKLAEQRPESPNMQMRITGASHDLQDKLVQFITREQQVNRATPFCKYLETELDRLHDACLEPAYEEITTVLNHYRKVSRKFRMREAVGDQISPLEDVPSAFQSQQPQHHRPVTAIPVCISTTYSRVSQLQQESTLPSSTYYSTSRGAAPSPEFQPGPSQWPKNPPPASVWKSQECGYVEQVNQQFNVEQQQQQMQYHTLQTVSTSTQGYVPPPCQSAFVQLPSQHPQQQTRGPWQLTPEQPLQSPPLPPMPAQQSQHNVSQDSVRQYLNPDKDLSA